MNRKRALQKVVAFVTRGTGENFQLLFFNHPAGWVQLPAGTVELGESLEEAVIREVREETDLVNTAIISHLGVIQEKSVDSQFHLLRASKLFDEPAFDASSSSNLILNRGAVVTVVEEVGAFSRIRCDPIIPGSIPPRRMEEVDRYFVRSSLLGKDAERHLFHLETDEETGPTWKVNSDGHSFSLFWAPLDDLPEVTHFQQSWLESTMPYLRSYQKKGRI